MALEFLYWPFSLPRKTLLDSFSENVSSSVIRDSPDNGLPLQRNGGDYPIDPVTCAYVMTRTQKATFQEFCRLAGARSFWMPHPDPLHPTYTQDKWWYARISQEDRNSAGTFNANGGGKFRISLTLEFWRGVPGVTPPEGAA